MLYDQELNPMAEKDLIEKWLRGDLSPGEQAAFDKLPDSSLYRKIADNAAAFRASAFSKAPDFDSFRDRLDARQASSAGRRAWFRPLLRIASVLLIGLLISYFFVYNPGTQIETAAGEKREVTLPDASLVLLNAHSELRFKTSRWESERSVTLEGEAYFRVAKGSRFDVVTPQGTVSVLGTEFNVRQRGDDLEVRCYEGLVRVETPGRQLELPAGRFFQLLQGQVSSGTHQESGPSWAQEISRFDRVPLAEVAAELERLFGVEIQLEGVDGNRLFTGSFLHEDLDQALQAVTRPLSLEYHKSSDQRIIIRPVAP